MTANVRQAIEVLQTMPKGEREKAALAIIDYGASRPSRYRLTDEQAAEIRRRISRKKRTFLTLAQVRKRLRHLGA
ncbi:hypothetical protein A2853_03155 [Candidatus Kaiserbacteria bacterium RIFCSPHIGHO2_01_FULL_55_17]|uniref:Uncharacterized protein n=1 Tax=Candidatus Kaiserbacteria bacterium RIFCSPHIGHO2_01_FULL_55_17 TaxID=1798484 RepID=A0A1F6D8X4_9BACT|nr:MAG: hypothetical protein A2853_03155 [Candidatus Kaiserbacteria bacterium RIFCSPHIGHO2_01_FULL_55_17]